MTLAAILRNYDAGMSDLIDQHMRELKPKLSQIKGISKEQIECALASFRRHAEAKTAQSRNELRREAFTVVK